MSGGQWEATVRRWESDGGEEAGDEQRTSRLAIAALVVGLISWLALLHPALWCIPALGVALAVFGLRTVARQPTVYSGRRVALTGMILSLFCLAYAPSRQFTREQHLYRDAERFGRQWLELVCTGKLREAHQLRLVTQRRVAADETLDHFYQDTDAKVDLDQFSHEAVIQRLYGDNPRTQAEAAEAPFQIRLDARLGHEIGPMSDDRVKLRFMVDRKLGGKAESTSVTLELQRMADALTREGQWMVRDMTTPP